MVKMRMAAINRPGFSMTRLSNKISGNVMVKQVFSLILLILSLSPAPARENSQQALVIQRLQGAMFSVSAKQSIAENGKIARCLSIHYQKRKSHENLL